MNRLHINNERFSIRVVEVAKNYNLTTVGQVKRLINRMQPHAKLSLPLGYMRVTSFKRIFEQDLKNL